MGADGALEKSEPGSRPVEQRLAGGEKQSLGGADAVHHGAWFGKAGNQRPADVIVRTDSHNRLSRQASRGEHLGA